MLRKTLLAGVAVVALLGSLAITSEAAANPFKFKVGYSAGYGPGPVAVPSYKPVYQTVYQPAHICHYDVLYRHCVYEPWQVYGAYHDHCQAHAVADHLRAHGYSARVSRH